MQKNSVELRQERAEFISTAKYIADRSKKEGRVLNDEELVETTELTGQAEQLEEEIKKIERAEHQMDQIEKLSVTTLAPPVPRSAPEITNGVASETTFTIPASYRRNMPLRAFKSERDAYIAGQWFNGAILKNKRSDNWCRNHGVYESLAQSEGSSTAGGLLTPDVLSQAIIDNRNKFGVARRLVNVHPMSSDVEIVPRVSGSITATFGAEAATIAESDKAWDNVNLTAQKMGIITRASRELADDAIISIIDNLAMEHARALAVKEDKVVFSGDLTAADGGIEGMTTRMIDEEATLAGVIDGSTDGFDDMVIGDFTSLLSLCPQYALANAKWLISQGGYANGMMRLAAAAGGNSIQTLPGELGLQFLGYPVVIQNTFSQGGTADLSDLIMVAFGDFSMGILLGDRHGIRMSVSEEAFWTQDQIGVRSTERIDVKVHDLGDATDPGPIVGLLGLT